MVGLNYRFYGQAFEQTLGGSEGQGSLAHFSSWSHKESDMTEQLKNNSNKIPILLCRHRVSATCIIS